MLKFKYFLALLTASSILFQLCQAGNTTDLTANVLFDIATHFFIKPKIKFSVISFQNIQKLQNDVVSEFLWKLNRKGSNVDFQYTSYLLNIEKNHQSFRLRTLSSSAFLFLNDIRELEHFEETSIVRGEPPINFIISIEGLTLKQLKNAEFLKRFHEVNVLTENIFVNSFFILNQGTKFSLLSAEWFTKKACNKLQFKTINVFMKKSLTWKLRLKSYEKFTNYHGCELVMMLPVEDLHGAISFISGFAVVDENLNSFKIHGLTPQIMKRIAKPLNFKPAFQPARVNPSFLEHFDKHSVDLISINKSTKIPQVFFDVIRVSSKSFDIELSNVFVNGHVSIYVTPHKVYTPYEKLVLPFDPIIWILLLITFPATLVVIYIVNYLSQKMHADIIPDPFWSIVQICFGISQIKMPIMNRPRIILVLFIWFCLIFRTCYQKLLFKLIINPPISSWPKNMNEAIDRNYTFYMMEYQAMSDLR